MDFLENGFGAILTSKTNVQSISKGHFADFCKYLRDEVQQFSGKVRQSVENCLNQNLFIGSFLENGFEATFSSKTNVVRA